MNTRPTAQDAINAIKEKAKIKPPTSKEDYKRFCKEMDKIDQKYKFKQK